MTISTQTLTEAGRLLSTVLVDSIEILDVGNPVTVGINVERSLTAVSGTVVGSPLPGLLGNTPGAVKGLVQTTALANAVESRSDSVYSIKVDHSTSLKRGQAVRVLSCAREPELVGKVLLVDKVGLNGLSMIRKAVASDFDVVNQEGKAGLQ
jgi:hypothetical protein